MQNRRDAVHVRSWYNLNLGLGADHFGGLDMERSTWRLLSSLDQGVVVEEEMEKTGRTELTVYNPRGKSGPLPGFANKVLLEHIHFIGRRSMAVSCFRAKLSSGLRNPMACRSESISYLGLCRKSVSHDLEGQPDKTWKWGIVER